jgi:thiol-disulfide isomerase/thioredoxin
MDRLSTLVLVAALAAGCGEDRRPPAGGRDRVNAVAARKGAADPAAVCDVFRAPDAAPRFELPALTAPAPAPAAGWRWINVWATWCKPCVEELPRLPAWRARLARGGPAVSLELVSADEDDQVVAAFRAKHPATPATLRLADAEALPAWMERLGVPGATLPVHVFVDPEGRVRCVRASAIEDADLPALEALIGGAR